MPKLAADQSGFAERLDCIAILKMRAREFERIYGVQLEEYWEDGLGRTVGGLLELPGKLRMVVCELQEIKNPRLVIEVPRTKLKIEVLREIEADLRISNEDCLWSLEDGYEGEYELYRTDDNGNRFSVKRFEGKIEAALAKEQIEKSLHKQTYWIERAASRSG